MTKVVPASGSDSTAAGSGRSVSVRTPSAQELPGQLGVARGVEPGPDRGRDGGADAGDGGDLLGRRLADRLERAQVAGEVLAPPWGRRGGC